MATEALTSEGPRPETMAMARSRGGKARRMSMIRIRIKICLLSEISGEDSQGGSDEETNQDRDKGSQQGVAGAAEDSAHEVPSEVVGSKKMFP